MPHLLLLAMLLACGTAHACYSGLLIIPTAESLDKGQYSIEPQVDGVFGGSLDEERILNTEVGLGGGFEAGLDFDLSREAESRVLLNAKYLLREDHDRSPAIALGVCNLATHVKASPYLVASHRFGSVRGHGGLISTEGSGRWFVGLDHEVNDRLTLMADHTSGPDNYTSIGGSYRFSNSFSILGGVLLPNDAGEGTGFTIHFVFSGGGSRGETGSLPPGH